MSASKPEEFRTVAAEGQSRTHIVRMTIFFDGNGKALCGTRAFPSKWYVPAGIDAAASHCPDCVMKYRSRRDAH